MSARRRHLLRLLTRLSILLGLTVGAIGCIPTFQGMKPITQEELKPKEPLKDLPAAEYLFLDEGQYHRWGQVDQGQRTTLWRVYQRIRINKPEGIQASAIKYLPPSWTQWDTFNRINAFQAKVACPDGSETSIGSEALKKVTFEWDSRGDDVVLFRTPQYAYRVIVPGVKVGCIIDYYWELDVNTQFDNFFFGLQGVRIPIMRNLPIRRAHLSYLHAENLQVRAEVDQLTALEILKAPDISKMTALRAKIAATKDKDAKATDPAKKAEAAKKAAEAAKLSPEEQKKIEATEENDDATAESDHVRIQYDKRTRIADVYLKDIPALEPAKRVALRASCAKAAINSYLCSPPSVYLRITRFLDTRIRAYQDIRNRWRDVVNLYTRDSWPFQEDRGGFQFNFQMDEEEETADTRMTKAAKQAVQGITERDAKIRAIHDHVRNHMFHVRLVGVGLVNAAINSRNRLHKVYEVAQGNTYEVNMVLLVMLRAVGIRAYAVLVPNTRAPFKEALPDMDPFRGGYIAVYLPPESEGPWRGIHTERSAERAELGRKGFQYEGAREVTDGTLLNAANTHVPFGSLNGDEENMWSLVIDYAGGRFFKTPEKPSSYSRKKLSYKLTLQDDGSVEGQVEAEMTGHHATAFRTPWIHTNPGDWPQWFKQGKIDPAWMKICPRTTFKPMPRPKLHLKDPSQPVRFTYAFRSPHCFSYSQNLRHFHPPLAFPEYEFTAKTREIPAYFGFPQSTRIEVEVKLPAGVAAPSPKREEKTLPNKFRLLNEVSNGSVYRRITEYENFIRELPPSDYKELKEFWDKLKLADERKGVFFQK